MVSASGTDLNASIVYAGYGRRVKSEIAGVKVLFVGEFYEVKGSQVTKYYFAVGARIASRICTSRTCGQPVYFLSDHLGSASLALDSIGTVLSETLYRASGEVRYTTTLPIRYTYTGHYSDSYIKCRSETPIPVQPK